MSTSSRPPPPPPPPPALPLQVIDVAVQDLMAVERRARDAAPTREPVDTLPELQARLAEEVGGLDAQVSQREACTPHWQNAGAATPGPAPAPRVRVRVRVRAPVPVNLLELLHSRVRPPTSGQLGAIARRALAARLCPPALRQELGVRPVRGLLLYGPPGCGKVCPCPIGAGGRGAEEQGPAEPATHASARGRETRRSARARSRRRWARASPRSSTVPR